MTGHWITRDGRHALVDRRGLISSNVIVGRMDGRPSTWRADGKWRWDDQADGRDLVEKVETLAEMAEALAKRGRSLRIEVSA